MLRRDEPGAAEYEAENLRVAIGHVNRLRPRFVVISGDLVNAFPPSTSEASTAREEQHEVFHRCLSDLDKSIPLVLLPGNHVRIPTH
jgi:3',5'-cyclic AMP phosphodiesterase CpdA